MVLGFGVLGFGVGGFGNVVLSDTGADAGADSTAAALRVTCCVMITHARERGRPGSAGQPAAAPPGSCTGRP
ncbi:hypothetical protein SSP531S_38520 [Streptomyces spongiicola]|uniref:Uncharacterized protein n=1 Tax=Streptomyces spongiicola TaxID=1690221 RepID=A0A388T0D9_9ACTN|nr:hypothetical protein SSP531S_38520 [Streptomyces spongiicola]